MTFTITDYDGRPIVIGGRVQLWEDPQDDPTPENSGIVLDLGEWEGDVDDEGRSIGVPPHIRVRFGNGAEGSYPTSEWEYENTGYYDQEPVKGQVEELIAIEPCEHEHQRVDDRSQFHCLDCGEELGR